MIDILHIVTHIEPAGERLFSHHLGAVVILSSAWSGLVSLVVEGISEVCSTLFLLKVCFVFFRLGTLFLPCFSCSLN
jgi:hypothetical protein